MTNKIDTPDFKKWLKQQKQEKNIEGYPPGEQDIMNDIIDDPHFPVLYTLLEVKNYLRKRNIVAPGLERATEVFEVYEVEALPGDYCPRFEDMRSLVDEMLEHISEYGSNADVDNIQEILMELAVGLGYLNGFLDDTLGNIRNLTRDKRK